MVAWLKKKVEDPNIGKDPVAELLALHKRQEEILGGLSRRFTSFQMSILVGLQGDYHIYMTPNKGMSGVVVSREEWNEVKKLGDQYFAAVR